MTRSDRGDAVNLHVPYRIVALSANHLLVLEHGRIHRAERFEARLQHARPPAVAFDFSEGSSTLIECFDETS